MHVHWIFQRNLLLNLGPFSRLEAFLLSLIRLKYGHEYGSKNFRRLDPRKIDWHRKPSLRRAGSGRKKDENRRASAAPGSGIEGSRSLNSNSHRQLGQSEEERKALQV